MTDHSGLPVAHHDEHHAEIERLEALLWERGHQLNTVEAERDTLQRRVNELEEVRYWAKRVAAPPGANDWREQMQALRQALKNTEKEQGG